MNVARYIASGVAGAGVGVGLMATPASNDSTASVVSSLNSRVAAIESDLGIR
jgi:hypothetical protein